MVCRTLLDSQGDARNLYLSREETEMDAIIGKYRVSMEGTALILTHPAGISFDLTLDEAVELMEFISVYQDAIATMLHDTAPRIRRIVIDEQANALERESSEHNLPE